MFFLRIIANVLKYKKLQRDNIIISPCAAVRDTSFEGYNEVARNSRIEHSRIGLGSYIREDCIIKQTSVGRFCSIAPEVEIVFGNHPTHTYVSTHPCFYSGKPKAGLDLSHKTDFKEYSYADPEGKWYCRIGNDVWIGTHALLLGGIEIGDGAIIAAGSVVTKSVPPYAIVAGNPARVIRYRFSEEQISTLLRERWWEHDLDWIRKNVSWFDDIERFIGRNSVD